MISCIALDDEPLALELIRAYAAQVPWLDLRKTFTRASEARQWLVDFPVDLIFLDIQMPDINGVDFYKSAGQETPVIFTTAYSQYAVTGFDLKAVDYLLKPFTLSRFVQAAEQARVYIQARRDDAPAEQKVLQVRAEYSLVSIPLAEILYLETMDDYIRIHIEGRKPVMTLMRMRQMEDRLPANEFVRIHRSYIVPLVRIERVRNKVVSIAGLEIPIGGTYETEFWERFKG
ncbi:MAG: LytTR family DNA-binding domain-containing protein [Bacteroidia bacterium]